MPNVLLDRISLPNLRLYTSVSVLLVSSCLYYAISSTSDPFWRLDNNVTATDSFFPLANTDTTIGSNPNTDVDDLLIDRKESADKNILLVANNINQIFTYITPDQRKLFNDTRTIGTKFKDVVAFMVQEPVCIWVSRWAFELLFIYFFSIWTSITWTLRECCGFWGLNESWKRLQCCRCKQTLHIHHISNVWNFIVTRCRRTTSIRRNLIIIILILCRVLRMVYID